jgi:hypothetical protein
VTALAVQLMVPAIRVHRGLAPPSECALPGAPKIRGLLPVDPLFKNAPEVTRTPGTRIRDITTRHVVTQHHMAIVT